MTTFDKLVIAGTQLVLVPVLASHWGLAAYGQWLLLATLPQFLSMSDFGFATAAGTRMTIATARGDRDEAIRIFQSAWRAILVASAAIVSVLLPAVWLLPAEVFGGAGADAAELRLTLAILIVYGVVAVQGSIFFAGFRAGGLFPTGAFWNAMVLLIENAALVATVAMGGHLAAAAAAWLGGRIVGLIGQNILLRRKLPWLTIGLDRGSWAEARALLGPAGAVMLLPLAQALVLQGCALMVGMAAGHAAVPAFAATRTLSRVGMQMCWIVTTPLMPELSAAMARRDRRRMAAMLLATLLFSALLVVPYAIGFMVLGRPLIGVWTHGAIVPPEALVWAMGLSILFGGIWYPISNLILAADRQAHYTTWYVGFALAGLPLAYLAARPLGATGAALVMAAIDFAMLLVVVRLTRRFLAGPHELAAALARTVRIGGARLRGLRGRALQR